MSESKEQIAKEIINILGDDVTPGDILYAVNYVKSERARKRANYKPSDRPVGRPKKIIDFPVKV